MITLPDILYSVRSILRLQHLNIAVTDWNKNFADCCLIVNRLSQAGTVPKWLNAVSRKQRHLRDSIVFWRQRSRRNSDGVTPTGAPNRGGVSSNWRFSTNISLINFAYFQLIRSVARSFCNRWAFCTIVPVSNKDEWWISRGQSISFGEDQVYKLRIVFSWRELAFTFAICYRLSVCRLSVCRLWRWCTLLRRLNFSAIFFTVR